MELRHLRYFVAVAEASNFSRAAERLHIAQPPLSKQIRDLEAELGVQLLDRRGRPLKLTPAGSVFLAEARSILAQVDRSITAARQAERGESGQLTVGFNSSAANSILSDVLRAVRSSFGDIELVLQELTARQQLEALRKGEIDVGFMHRFPIEEDDGTLNFLTVLRESFVAVLPETHPLATRTEISLNQLAGDRFILPPSHLGTNLYAQIASLCRQSGFEPNVIQEAQWMQTILSLVSAGMGVTLLPENVLSLQRQGVVSRGLLDETPVLEMAVVWSSDRVSVVLDTFVRVTQEVTRSSGD
ncbi:LysR family transcriptional regulator [Oscillatoriales cyanobacterium LEGE 11467]|uniref:LysR family transcriptional regulator n=1 Tax=Zarconia navalis LEGE 11467 TaxID=1828826 RepID=A0A928ZA95_9CYAN|nr:LysR substrate-binding domain-containing protein [Zarconia navalis]MBE9042609.1 LysR family transcriptional regulator [Zarconia navalis LEGE 11467]